MPKVLEKSRAISLLTLRAGVAYKKGEILPKDRMHRKSFGIRGWGLQGTDWNYRAMKFKLCSLYQILVGSQNQEEQDRGEGHTGDRRGANSVLEWKHEGKWQLGIPTNR